MYCEQCGNFTNEEENFCGECGAWVSRTSQYTTPTQKAASRPYTPKCPPVRSRKRRIRRWVLALGALIVLLAGAGTAAYATLGPGLVLPGWTDFKTSSTEENTTTQQGSKSSSANTDSTQETTTTAASVAPDASPDPAFDQLLPILKLKTSIPIVLPAELPEELKNVAIDGNRDASPQSGDGYGIVFLSRPATNVHGEQWNNSEALATLEVFPQSQPKFNQDYDATSVETVELPDGTEAKLRRMEPRTHNNPAANPYWEGELDKYGRRYTIMTVRDKLSKDAMKQILSTMVEVPNEGTGESTTQGVSTPKEDSTTTPSSSEAAQGNTSAKATQDNNTPPLGTKPVSSVNWAALGNDSLAPGFVVEQSCVFRSVDGGPFIFSPNEPTSFACVHPQSMSPQVDITAAVPPPGTCGRAPDSTIYCFPKPERGIDASSLKKLYDHGDLPTP